MITGENSIIKQAKRAKIETARAELEEKVRLAVTASYDRNGDFDGKQLEKELEKEKIEYDLVDDEIVVPIPPELGGGYIVIKVENGEIRFTDEKPTLFYTVKYNSNGGQGTMPDDTYEHNEEKALSENKFTKLGYIFSGWSKEAGGEKVYNPSEKVKNLINKRDGIVNLYAVWTPSTYAITYELNKGTLNTGNPTYAIYDEEIVIDNPTRVGYGFAGWTISEMTETKHVIGDETPSDATVSGVTSTKFKNLRSEVGTVVFTAIWTARTDTKYIVEHYQMDTSGHYPSTATATQNLLGTSDETLKFTDLEQGYSGFTYRYGEADGETVEKTTVAPDGSRIIKLYYERNKYTITYKGNGGNTPTSITNYYGVDVTLPTPSRTGYTFNGWYTEATGGTKVDYTTLPLGNVEIYAQWTARTDIKYIVEHYQMNTSGSYPSTTTLSNTYTNGTSDASLTLANFKQSYTGLQYSYGQVNGTTTATTTVAPDGSRVIKLYYTRNRYRFTLGTHAGVTNGGTGTGDYYYGATITLKGTLKTGYTGNISWASSNTSLVGNKTTANGASTTFAMPLGAVSMTPSATLITYTVSYNANGGSGQPGNQTKTYGQNLTLSGTRPSRTGYTFQGWATSSGGSVAYQPDGTYSNNSAVTLFAVWKINTWTVSYNANGGSGQPGNQTKTYGQNLTLSGTRPSRTGYTFQGWATSSGGSVAYQPSGTYSNNLAITLYAVWKINTWTVSYNANGGSGQPGNQTKTYGQNLTLSSTRPTRPNYTFQGWATSSGGSVAYQPGGTYSNNSAVTLWAVWKAQGLYGQALSVGREVTIGEEKFYVIKDSSASDRKCNIVSKVQFKSGWECSAKCGI